MQIFHGVCHGTDREVLLLGSDTGTQNRLSERQQTLDLQLNFGSGLAEAVQVLALATLKDVIRALVERQKHQHSLHAACHHSLEFVCIIFPWFSVQI